MQSKEGKVGPDRGVPPSPSCTHASNITPTPPFGEQAHTLGSGLGV